MGYRIEGGGSVILGEMDEAWVSHPNCGSLPAHKATEIHPSSQWRPIPGEGATRNHPHTRWKNFHQAQLHQGIGGWGIDTGGDKTEGSGGAFTFALR